MFRMSAGQATLSSSIYARSSCGGNGDVFGSPLASAKVGAGSGPLSGLTCWNLVRLAVHSRTSRASASAACGDMHRMFNKVTKRPRLEREGQRLNGKVNSSGWHSSERLGGRIGSALKLAKGVRRQVL